MSTTEVPTTRKAKSIMVGTVVRHRGVTFEVTERRSNRASRGRRGFGCHLRGTNVETGETVGFAFLTDFDTVEVVR